MLPPPSTGLAAANATVLWLRPCEREGLSITMSSRESFYVLRSKRLAGDIISLFCPFLDHRCGGVGLHKEMNVNTEIHDDLKYHYF